MRTTLSLDDAVLLAVKERARREKLTAGEVLSDLARQALTLTTWAQIPSSNVLGPNPMEASCSMSPLRSSSCRVAHQSR